MKNIMMSNKEREALEEIFKGVDKLVEAHDKELTFERVRGASKVEKVHSLLYMTMLKDFLQDIGAIRSMLHVEEDQFIDIVTENGKLSLDEVENKLMTQMMMELQNQGDDSIYEDGLITDPNQLYEKK